LFLQISLRRNAGGHDGGELNVVHDVGAGVGSKVFFKTFLLAQPMPAAKPVRVAASMIVFTSLLSDMVIS